MEDDVPRDGHGVREVPVDLVEDVLGRAAEQDGARLGVLALCQEGEVSVKTSGSRKWGRKSKTNERQGEGSLVTELLDVEESALCADV